MKNSVATSSRPAVEAFLALKAARGRIDFVIDATASRMQTWNHATRLQADMFREAATIGGLELQLIYYRGVDECVASRWFSDDLALARLMTTIHCRAGETKIERSLGLVRDEHDKQKVSAAIVVSDACEEIPERLFAAAEGLGGVPLFMFQESDDAFVTSIYRELARITGGAHCQFNNGSAQRLGELLRAVAAFAVGGRLALKRQGTPAARLLLTQVKEKGGGQ